MSEHLPHAPEAPLRHDIRLVTSMLGETLTRTHGQEHAAAAVPAARPAWPGSAVNSAKRAVGIAPVPVFRRSHRGEGSRKNSPLITWRTTLRPTHEEKNA